MLLTVFLCSCGGPALEHIWEADLEACHLLLKGLDQRTSSISETQDLPSIPGSGSDVLPFTKEEADCAMLTALGGRWCPEADLQHSEFTKVKPQISKMDRNNYLLHVHGLNNVCLSSLSLYMFWLNACRPLGKHWVELTLQPWNEIIVRKICLFNH